MEKTDEEQQSHREGAASRLSCSEGQGGKVYRSQYLDVAMHDRRTQSSAMHKEQIVGSQPALHLHSQAAKDGCAEWAFNFVLLSMFSDTGKFA